MIKPWITPYAGERFAGVFGFDGEKIFYGEDVPAQDRERDERGVLWQPAPENTDGEVWWKEMHTGRQRQAMERALCQVCGQLCPEKPLSWLIPAPEVKVNRPNGRPFRTASPPVCASCVPVAMKACPNLSTQPPMLLQVRGYRLWGVWGDLVSLPVTPLEKQLGRGPLLQTEVPFSATTLGRIMGRHLVAEIYDYRRVRMEAA